MTISFYLSSTLAETYSHVVVRCFLDFEKVPASQYPHRAPLLNKVRMGQRIEEVNHFTR